RLLLDYHLAKQGIKSDQIKGYGQEVNTHLEVGLSILKGEADVGIGIRYVATLLNLEFIPIGWERFDLVCRQDDFYRKPVKEFFGLLEPLNIDLFFSKRFPGYDFKDTGKIIFESKHES
ncbi:MAG: substrate-binding domain-containing protein, partial [Candidatus Desulfofervidaceae bacterium]|nr:substrate-binding domain-containing protein [Candidatus Desulfofervidaceae bacterium]